jgi:hypothetical protein
MFETCAHCGAALSASDARCAICGASVGSTSLPLTRELSSGGDSSATSLPGTTSVFPLTSSSQSEYTARQAQGAALPPALSASGPKPRNGRRFWLILGLVGALVLALCAGCSGALYWAISSQLAPSQAGAQVLYKSSLRNADSAWPSHTDHCVYAGAGYFVDGGICLAHTSAMDDFDLSVTVAQASGATAGLYGVLFRQHDGLNAYILDISSDGRWRFRRIAPNAYFPDQPNEQIFILPTRDPFIRAGGAANTLLIHAVGGHFTLYANH